MPHAGALYPGREIAFHVQPLDWNQRAMTLDPVPLEARQLHYIMGAPSNMLTMLSAQQLLLIAVISHAAVGVHYRH